MIKHYDQLDFTPVFQALLLTFGMTSGLIILNEIEYYDARSIFNVFCGTFISLVGIGVIVFKPRLKDDDGF